MCLSDGEGLVRTEPYRSIFLTEDGLALAQACRGRHQLVVDFLLAIPHGVADMSLDIIEVGGGTTAVTGTIDCENTGEAATTLSGNTTIHENDLVTFDTDNSPTAGGTYALCVTYNITTE